VAVRVYRQKGPVGTNPRVDNNQMDGTWREKSIGSGQEMCGCSNILSGDQMSDIDDADIRVMAEDDTFEDAHIFIAQAKIGKECHDRTTRVLRMVCHDRLLRMLSIML
jgi:hypothetical protein